MRALSRWAARVPLHLNLLELFLLALCVFSGALNGARLAATGATPDGTPPWAAAAWYALLVFGGLGGLAGAFVRDPLTSALITRAAMWPVAAGAVAFAYVVAARGNPLSAGLVAAFGLFAAGHGIQVGRRARAEAATVAAVRREVNRP